MICPHCSVNLLRRERNGRVCGGCKRPFALEPKESVLGLHDIRVRALADKLGDGRGLRYALPQLWYAASRKHMPDLDKRFLGRRFLVSVPIVGLGVLGIIGGAFPAGPALAVILGAVILVNIAMTAFKARIVRGMPVKMPVPYEKFRAEVLDRWGKVYGGPPPGSIPEGAAPPPGPPRPRLAAVCPDRGVLACLAANDAAGAWGMALADRLEHLPPGVPVLILHDASVAGLRFAAETQAALGPRAVPVGIAPRALLDKEKALRLRHGRPEPDELQRLRAGSVSEAEIAWLADGWWSPLAAVPPAKLLAAVGSAVQRVEDAGDPDRRRARAVGFLTWPTG
ncbi:hypothetical protein [Nocardia arizonensis]|uniref:hypothetical protein n=1 Tax=Nocardia arizonensis TaxID=1141647 RepID=UPI0006D1D939|nr:hypothetical protein [Nocardia arizonensis]